MKKIIIVCISLMIVLSGCAAKEATSEKEVEEKVETVFRKFTRETDINGMHSKSEAFVVAEDGYVLMAEVEDSTTVQDEDTLKYFIATLEYMNSLVSEIDGYHFNYEVDDLTVKSNTNIDYTTIDGVELAKVDPTIEELFDEEGHALLEVIVKIYESMGFVEEK